LAAVSPYLASPIAALSSETPAKNRYPSLLPGAPVTQLAAGGLQVALRRLTTVVKIPVYLFQ